MIEFTEEEKQAGLSHLNLYAEGNDVGYFDADYIAPEKRLIYGWWTPSDMVMQELKAKNRITDDDKPPFWSAIEYDPTDEELEQQLIQSNAKASDFLHIVNWDGYWTLSVDKDRTGWI